MKHPRWVKPGKPKKLNLSHPIRRDLKGGPLSGKDIINRSGQVGSTLRFTMNGQTGRYIKGEWFPA